MALYRPTHDEGGSKQTLTKKSISYVSNIFNRCTNMTESLFFKRVAIEFPAFAVILFQFFLCSSDVDIPVLAVCGVVNGGKWGRLRCFGFVLGIGVVMAWVVFCSGHFWVQWRCCLQRGFNACCCMTEL